MDPPSGQGGAEAEEAGAPGKGGVEMPELLVEGTGGRGGFGEGEVGDPGAGRAGGGFEVEDGLGVGIAGEGEGVAGGVGGDAKHGAAGRVFGVGSAGVFQEIGRAVVIIVVQGAVDRGGAGDGGEARGIGLAGGASRGEAGPPGERVERVGAATGIDEDEGRTRAIRADGPGGLILIGDVEDGAAVRGLEAEAFAAVGESGIGGKGSGDGQARAGSPGEGGRVAGNEEAAARRNLADAGGIEIEGNAIGKMASPLPSTWE